jgi:hypothetical protein
MREPFATRELGIENDQDDVDRRFLSGDFGRLDRDQGCFAASFCGCRNRAPSKQNRDGPCPERGDEVRPVGVAQRPRRGRRDRGGAGCSAGAGGNSAEQARDDQDSQPPAALARCQRQDSSIRTPASSPSHSQRDEKGHSQQPTAGKSRSLALPAGCDGQSFEVIGPLAKMQPVKRADPPAIAFYWKLTSRISAEGGRNRCEGLQENPGCTELAAL